MATGDDSFTMAVARQWRPALGLLAIALVTGGITSRVVQPVYRARATLWVEGVAANGAVAPQQAPLDAPAMYSVIERLGLHVAPAPGADAALFRGLGLAQRFMPGDYSLTIDDAGRQWRLLLNDIPFGASGDVGDGGAVGDSIGRRLGLRWRPDSALLVRHAGTTQHFVVTTPRSVRDDITSRSSVSQPRTSRFMSLELMDVQPDRAARVLNAIGNAYIERARATGQARITMLDSAVAPHAPYRGSRSQVLMQALVIGLAMGLAAAILLAALARRARTDAPSPSDRSFAAPLTG